MKAFAADYHAFVEPLRDADSASYTPTNSVATSNHLNGTAFDLNWNSHPFKVKGTFTAAQMKEIRELQKFYTQDGLLLVFWAGDWKSPIDEMHWQMGYGTYGDVRLQRFIDHKIRPDGFSTYRRGGESVPPVVSKADGYALEIIAEGQRRNITARGIQIALSVVYVESNFKMYANRSVPESMSIPHDAVGSDHDSVGLFQQRCPMWGPAHVLMDPKQSAGLFYDRLAKMDYNNTANEPGWYAAEVQRPAKQYRYRYQERMPDAMALYDRLVGISSGGEGFMSALSPEEQRALYNEVMARRGSRSPLRHVGSEWAGDMGDVTWNTDGSVHVLVTFLSGVILGDPDAIALLREVAGVNTNRYPERLHDSRLAQAMLNLIDNKKTTTSAPKTGVTPGADPSPSAPQPIPQQSIPIAPTYVPQQAISAPAPAPKATMPVNAPETGLLAEINFLRDQLREVSETVRSVVQGKEEE